MTTAKELWDNFMASMKKGYWPDPSGNKFVLEEAREL